MPYGLVPYTLKNAPSARFLGWHFGFSEYDMLAHLWVVFTHFHFALSIFRLCIFGFRVKEAGFRIIHLHDNL